MKRNQVAFNILHKLGDIKGEVKCFYSPTLEGLRSGSLNDFKTIHSLKVERVLRKLLDLDRCVSCNCFEKRSFRVERFTLKKTSEQFYYLYHCSSVPPSIILKEGLKVRYSLSFSKPHGPLIFLSTKDKWPGKYTYRVGIKQSLYYDTNLNWKMKEGHHSFCVRNGISPKLIELISVNN